MRYKNNVLDKLTRIDTIVSRLNLQINKNMTQDQMLESLDVLRGAIDEVREMISIEPDDFEQQFSPR